ncbi:MAG: xylulokinase [Chloroflexota bacterium]
MPAYFLGIDVSTTATKALLIDDNGEVISVAATEYPFETPHPLWSEQDPQLWWQGTINSIRKVIKGLDATAIKAVGLTGQMHGLTLLDKFGDVLRPAILWNDQRTSEQCDLIRDRIGKTRLVQLTGNDALTGFTAPKVLWVQQYEPEIYNQITKILLPKDYVRFCLTGEFATDKAGASGTLLFDIKNRDWSHEVLSKLDIDPAWLPKTFEGHEITGSISQEAAEKIGLASGTPVVAGAGDQAAQAVGVGVVQEGIAALTLGTSGVVFASTSKPFVEPEGRLHAFCHAVPAQWHFMGVMLSAGGSLRWYRDTLAKGIDFDKLILEAAAIPPGSEGLFFLPYLMGERTPYPDPHARAGFIGLTVRHTRAHMTRAVLEGVAFGLRDSFELMKETGLKNFDQVRISGGGSKSELWRQILADVLGVELVTVNTTEGAAFGAALLAGVGIGVWPNGEEAIKRVVKVTGQEKPSEKNLAIYSESYKIYRYLYPALKDIFIQV